jgi:predicted MFS family arabinose efflux permease
MSNSIAKSTASDPHIADVKNNKKLIAWLIVSLFYGYQFTLRIIPGILSNDIIKNFALDTTQFGFFCGIYYIGYTAIMIPMSILMDRYDEKKVILITVLMTSIGLIPLLSESFYLLLLGRLMTGIGSVGAILSLFKITSMYFKPEKRSKMLGMGVTIGLLCAIYSGIPLSLMINNIGFKNAIIVLTSMGIVIGIIIFIVLPNHSSRNAKNQSMDIKTLLKDIKVIIKNRSLILLAVAGGLMVGPLEGFADAWSVTAFQVIHGWHFSDATLVPSTIFLGMCIGSSVIGFITEKTQRYYSTIAIASMLMLLCFLIITYGNGISSMVIFSILMIIGIASAYQIVLFAKVSILSRNFITTGSAVANMIVMVFGSVYHMIIGNVIMQVNTLQGTGYSVESIKFGILPIILGLILALPLIWIASNSEKSH